MNTPYAYLFDFLDSMGKFLRRPDVQRQLLAIVLITVLAILLTRELRRRIGPHYASWLLRNHVRFHSFATGHRTLLYYGVRMLATLANLLAVPIFMLLGLRAAAAWFVREAWLTGLLVRMEGIAWILAIYGLLLTVLYLIFRRYVVRQYANRLLTPALAVIIAAYVLRTVADMQALGAIPLLQLGETLITLQLLVTVSLLLYFWFAIAWAFTDLLYRALTHWTNANKGALTAGFTIGRYVLVGMGIAVAASMLGFNATTVAAITGGFSIGIGFALQDVLKNFFGGILILFEGSVRPGDYVMVGGNEGVVDRLNIRSTVVRTEDNVEIVVPNGDWLRMPITTYTGSSRETQLKLDFAFQSETNLAEVMALLTEAARMQSDVIASPAPQVVLLGFTATQIQCRLQFWVTDAIVKGRVTNNVRLAAYSMLSARNVALA